VVYVKQIDSACPVGLVCIYLSNSKWNYAGGAYLLYDPIAAAKSI